MFRLFLSQKSKIDRSRVMDWMSLAASDGELHENEARFIGFLAKKYGVAEKDWKAVRDNPQKVKPTKFQDSESQLQHLIDLIYLMVMDHEISEEEVDLVKHIAARFGCPASTVDKLVAQIVHSLNDGSGRKEIEVNESELESFLRAA